MTTNKTIEKIKKTHPKLEIINTSTTHALVKDEYGICKVQIGNLVMGCKPTISTAINKTEYFSNKLKQIQPNLTVIGEYTGALNKIKIKDKYGACNCIANGLLSNQIPCIETAINKTEYFINQAIEIHKDRYDYRKVNYINSKFKVKIICKEHGEFQQYPDDHLRNKGCIKCGHESKRSGWYNNMQNIHKKSNMYILQISGNNEVFMKFGVAVNLKKRITSIRLESKKKYKIKVIKVIENVSQYCYLLEDRFKRMIRYKKLQYIPKIKFGGMYECFKI